MLYLISITILLITISFIFDRQKTFTALKIALKKFINIVIPFIFMLILISIVFLFFSESSISEYLDNKNIYLNTLISALAGSISLMPGFIAFPLAGLLKQSGVSYMVISAFTSTLMMVGFLTFPVERNYLGTKVAIIRNIISFVIALAVAFLTGIFFGEIL